MLISEGIYIEGELIENLPSDLYIPPNAMRVLLDSFSGPLDLLLYLIRKQNIDILDIPIVKITEQYLLYIDLMEAHRFELAADYLLMAATLAEIKSRMLLPQVVNEEADEDDPRMALVRQLQQYEKIKQAAEALSSLPYLECGFHSVNIKGQGLNEWIIYPAVTLNSIQTAMQSLMVLQSHLTSHQIEQEALTVRDRMESIVLKVKALGTVPFYHLYTYAEGRQGLVVSMLAVLELAKTGKITLEQEKPFAQIIIRA